MPKSTTLLARGPTAREALLSILREISDLLPEATSPGAVLVVQARAEEDGSGFVAEGAFWVVPKRPEG